MDMEALWFLTWATGGLCIHGEQCRRSSFGRIKIVHLCLDLLSVDMPQS